MRSESILFCCLFLTNAASAQDGLLDITKLIPPEYYSLPTTDFGTLFSELKGTSKAAADAQCRGGYRIGNQVGLSLVTKLNPSCDELLLPLNSNEDNEWAVPQISFKETEKPAVLCHYYGYAEAFEKTVLNTALNCAKIFNDSLTLTLQIEYNRCYVSTAQSVTQLHLSFAGGRGFITGDYVLVPRDSLAWDEFVASLVSIVNIDGDEQKSAYLIQACRLGSTHAQQRKTPINFFDGRPHLGN
ncbi:MAG: hypothetical protein M3Q07_02655 [Pseudobdellovibrionaceae bacterium]|nr:hypothetical protein [Pseudobdellovibrionaceae bacterium]